VGAACPSGPGLEASPHIDPCTCISCGFRRLSYDWLSHIVGKRGLQILVESARYRAQLPPFLACIPVEITNKYSQLLGKLASSCVVHLLSPFARSLFPAEMRGRHLCKFSRSKFSRFVATDIRWRCTCSEGHPWTKAQRGGRRGSDIGKSGIPLSQEKEQRRIQLGAIASDARTKPPKPRMQLQHAFP
jgi:hypothetical protein